jgi:UDP-N-acetylmuramoylalanine--D-glutamate ligase
MLNKIIHKKIGIWGFGVTGQSILRYLSTIPCTITIFEQKELSEQQIQLVKKCNAELEKYPSTGSGCTGWLENQDFIIPSPGVNMDIYEQYHDKIIAELDLFASAHHNKIVAITGSVGKTSITHLLGQLLSATGASKIVGGNIGVGMLDLITTPGIQSSVYPELVEGSRDIPKHCVLELSSFQLEHSKSFAPDLAIITNVYPNHLDRHKTIERYFKAKYQIIANQTEDQQALLPISIIKECNAINKMRPNRYFFSMTYPTQDYLNELNKTDGLFFIENGLIVLQKNEKREALYSVDLMPAISLQENWVIIIATLYLMKIPLEVIEKCKHNLALPEHRLEKVASINNVDFYDDSKSTTNQSTMAAVQALCHRPICLFLGGISKGVDRLPLIEFLENKSIAVYCFGKEASALHALCLENNIRSFASPTLEEAFELCIQQLKPHDQVLLSPGGASYDLFKNYEERGKVFRNLVYARIGQ